jgi:hypothetical protein
MFKKGILAVSIAAAVAGCATDSGSKTASARQDRAGYDRAPLFAGQSLFFNGSFREPGLIGQSQRAPNVTGPNWLAGWTSLIVAPGTAGRRPEYEIEVRFMNSGVFANDDDDRLQAPGRRFSARLQTMYSSTDLKLVSGRQELDYNQCSPAALGGHAVCETFRHYRVPAGLIRDLSAKDTGFILEIGTEVHVTDGGDDTRNSKTVTVPIVFRPGYVTGFMVGLTDKGVSVPVD